MARTTFLVLPALCLGLASVAADCEPEAVEAAGPAAVDEDPCGAASPARGDWTGFPADGHQCYQAVRSFVTTRFTYEDAFGSDRPVAIGDAAWGATDGGCAETGREGDCCDAAGACSAWTDDFDMNQYNCDRWASGSRCDEGADIWDPRIEWDPSLVPTTYDVVVYPATESNGFGHIGFVDHAVVRDGQVVALWVQDSNWAGDEVAQYHCIAVDDHQPLGYFRLGDRATDTQTDRPLPEVPPWSQPPAASEPPPTDPAPQGTGGAESAGGTGGGGGAASDDLPTTCAPLAEVLGWRSVACEKEGNGLCGGVGLKTDDCDACCGSTCNFADDSCGGDAVCAWDGMRYCCQTSGKSGTPCTTDDECGAGEACTFNGERHVCSVPGCLDYGAAVGEGVDLGAAGAAN